MPGPAPKNPKVRQRRNRVAGATQLQDSEDSTARMRVPPLPRRVVTLPLPGEDGELLTEVKPWHAMTRAWWKDVWRSPMAAEFLASDVHGLFVLADLVDAYWYAPSTALATEIRLQRQCFGLTPIDRRRLQWEVKRVEDPKRKAPAPEAPSRRRIAGDPRTALHAVK